MGIDATILFRSDAVPDIALDREWSICKYSGWAGVEFDGACPTHEVDSLTRYYAPGYERGEWPSIAAVLMQLHEAPEVEVVWYGGDGMVGECDVERVLEISRHYMLHGNRPYYQKGR